MLLSKNTAILRILNVKYLERNVSRKMCLSVCCFEKSSVEPRKTPLYDFHEKKGGKLVDFAGYLLPVQYTDLSVSSSHIHTRNSASLFDVSHMLQTLVTGKHCLEWFETLCPVNLKGMKTGGSSLTVFLNEKGGILDDLIVTKVDSENLYIVSNAARADHDRQHMLESLETFKKGGKDVDIKFWDTSERALLALQGPKAVEVLQTLTKVDLNSLQFMNSTTGSVVGIAARITRCGYTGEDGVEISVPADGAVTVSEALLELEEVKLAGLGARDSLRLEAGLCLYGNDIDETTTPIEASLNWLIPKERRIGGTFRGATVVLEQINKGVNRKRVGLRLEKGPPARRGFAVKNPETKEIIGTVTSGCPSPSLGGSVAMAYVPDSLKKVGTELIVTIRNNDVSCIVAKMPFVPSKYYTKK